MNERQIANLTLCYEIGLSDIWKADFFIVSMLDFFRLFCHIVILCSRNFAALNR